MKKIDVANNDQIVMFVLAIVLCAFALWAIACGGGGSYSGSPTTPSPSPGSGGNIATVTLTSNGVSDAAPRINSGDRVRFTNNDTRVRDIKSTPHGAHNDCPGLNAIGLLQPGASGMSEPLTGSRGCGFHDHSDPDNTRFRGQVLVGLASGDPTPPTPGYLHR
jgi:hypothetical protein